MLRMNGIKCFKSASTDNRGVTIKDGLGISDCNGNEEIQNCV